MRPNIVIWVPQIAFGLDLGVSDISSSEAASLHGGVGDDEAADVLEQLDQSKIRDAFWSDIIVDEDAFHRKILSEGYEALQARLVDPARFEEAQAELESQLSVILQPQSVMRM